MKIPPDLVGGLANTNHRRERGHSKKSTATKRLLIAFDLDGTLAESKSPITPRMASLLTALLETHEVCVISGGAFPQFQTQLIDRLDAPSEALARLHLMPTSGTRYHRYLPELGAWKLEYSDDLDLATRKAITDRLTNTAKELGMWVSDPNGDIIEDRLSQVTYSALGQHATVEAKLAWDPDGSKKIRLRDAVSQALPDLQVRIGGSTSIDVTAAGVDKGFGMRKLMRILGLQPSDILFFGDKRAEGGNDYPVKTARIDCVAVDGWEQTAVAVEVITLIV
jgi:phosphomannomutase